MKYFYIPIPGLHYRTCRGCGHGQYMTEQISQSVKKGRYVEQRTGMCNQCGKDIDYTIPVAKNATTKHDVTALGEFLAPLRDKWRRTRDGCRKKWRHPFELNDENE